MRHLKPHEERVLFETRECCARLEKLGAFIDNPGTHYRQLPEAERELLRHQRVHMASLQRVLLARLNLWGLTVDHEPAEGDALWNPPETMPVEPSSWIVVQTQECYRWHPYKPNSQEARRGVRGRWQTSGAYGGWDNAVDPPYGPWRLADPKEQAA